MLIDSLNIKNNYLNNTHTTMFKSKMCLMNINWVIYTPV